MIQYSLYIHTFPNDKVYIGITRQKPKDRWLNGKGYNNNAYMLNAIQKYGWKNIKHEVLFTNLTKEEAEQKEIELISKYKSNQREYGYNIAKGGNINGEHSKETRRKISEGNKGKIISQEVRNKISLSTKGKKHKPMSDLTKEKQRQIHLNKTLSKETKEKMGKAVRCIETGIVYYASIEAERQTNIAHSNIINNCKGKRKSAGKLHWEYVN